MGNGVRGAGGNGETSARSGVSAGFKFCARGGNGVPVVTPCHSLVESEKNGVHIAQHMHAYALAVSKLSE